MNKQYLGDSVYVEIENGMFKLTTEDGIGVSNCIFLEIDTYESLVKYVTRQRELAAIAPHSPEE